MREHENGWRGESLPSGSSVCRQVSVLGKHTRSITCGAWNRQNLLVLGSEDHCLTVSNSDGDTLHQVSLRGSPSNVQFSDLKSDQRRNTTDNSDSSQYMVFLVSRHYSP